MNVLITNIAISEYTGTETYVKELAIELVNRGHLVEIFTLRMGNLSKELIEKGINVTSNLKKLKLIPDIIHAHHNITALKAISFFKFTPVVYFIHDRTFIFDHPYIHKNILRYVAVDYNCKERYCLENNFKEEDVEIVYNWVNTDRFRLKENINKQPKKALVFSNYLNDNNIYPQIKEACKELGVEVEIIGYSSGNICLQPEKILNEYDLVFAKAKAAIEAMATGAAVIVCDFRGLGGMVTSSNMKHFRDFNFGMKLMTNIPTKNNLIVEINKYDFCDTIKVSEYIIKESNFLSVVSQLEEIYSDVIIDFKNQIRGKYNSPFFQYIFIYKCIIVNLTKLRLKSKFLKLYAFLKYCLKK
ncbi:glycosyltransferase [uncultured Flavobacterium sp.]|uniref:glycosyltransferase n=1 Tax=uncultured Flavobacterium sp. TaxID=165435 RepID=UPI00293070A9|nr:glycosyltransferase [uncultured Flavobacterium sp.]